MPIQECTLPAGGKGYRWADDGMEKPFLAFDRASVRHFDMDGHLRVDTATLSKACVSPYLGAEIPDWQHLGLDANRVYQLLRPPEELAKAADSFRGKPLMMIHRPVSAGDHPHKMVVGAIGSDIAFDGDELRGSLTVWDSDAIAGIENDEQRQLSCGYRYRAVMKPGTWNGIHFDGLMTDLAANHVALVSKGRVPGAIVGDSALEVNMTGQGAATLSRKAVMVAGAMQVYLHPKLAADAQLDLRRAVKGTTTANFATRKPVLADRILTACDGKLAEDISKQELLSLLEMLEGDDTSVGSQPDPDDDDDDDADDLLADTPDDDPDVDADADRTPDDDNADVTPAGQDIPEEAEPETPANPEGEAPAEPEDATTTAAEAAGGDTPVAKALAFLKDLIRPEDLTMIEHILQPDSPAPKEPVVAEDEPTMKLPAAKGMVTKQAMDQAIAAATKAAERTTIARMNAIADAKTFVKPWVGEMHLATDSAEAVYRAALQHLNVDVRGLHPSAFKPVLSAQPKPGESVRHKANGAAPVAMDAAATSKYLDRFPNANRLVCR